MFSNYLAAALRNLVRNRLYAAINIAGLAMGFAAALLIAVYVRDEFTYDRYFPGYENIYLLGLSSGPKDRPLTVNDQNSPEFGPKLKLDFPFIESVVRIHSVSLTMRHGTNESSEQILWADHNLFDVLRFRPIAGKLEDALAKPDSIVVTRSLARKYFSSDDPRGQMIEMENFDGSKGNLTVTAVIEDFPSNIHVSASAIATGSAALSPIARFDANPPRDGMPIGPVTYLRIADRATAERVQRELPDFLRRHREPLRNVAMELTLEPLATLHFAPGGGMKPRGSINATLTMGAIGLLIVVAAGINFVNLMTARASRRAIEVGVRKVSGAVRPQLIAQFIGESLIYVILSTALGLGLASLLLPTVNAFLDRTMGFDLLSDPVPAAFIVVMATAIGVLAGMYPAFILSSFRPAAVLKSGNLRSHASINVRGILVALQFAFLIGLLIATVVIQRQTRFALTEAQRLDTNEVVIVTRACGEPFRNAVAALPGVRAVTCSTGAGIAPGSVRTVATGPDGNSEVTQLDSVEPGFFEFYGVTPVAGRLFADERLDEQSVIINEAFAKRRGFVPPQAAIGQTYGTSSTIIGVVPDFSAEGIRGPVQPTRYDRRFANTRDNQRILSIRLDGARIPETLKEVDRLWKETGQVGPITRFFLQQSIEDRYRDILRQGALFGAFTAVAIFIGLLGLFGMSAFAVEQRTKEIGIRKAMGATRADILRLLLWQFTKPVLWANVIAWPAAYFVMQRWLEGFAYHVDLAPWMFLAASAAAVAIATLTVIGHALLVARAQPSTALRYE